MPTVVRQRFLCLLLAGFCLDARAAFAEAVSPASVPAPNRGDLLAPAARERIVFDGRSRYNRVLVVDEGDRRSLYFGDLQQATQSTITKSDPRAVPMEYLRHAGSGLAFAKSRATALVVGLGGAAFPMLLRRILPAMRIDVVELDPLVREVARDFFGLIEDARLRVHIADGAEFMHGARARWDVIMLDAYGHSSIPEPLATTAFFADVARRLAPGGIVIANISDTDSARERAMLACFAKAFPACILQLTPRSDNVIAVAGAALPKDTKDIASALQALDREARLPFAVAPMAPLYHPCGE
jgi:spermidine synthase